MTGLNAARYVIAPARLAVLFAVLCLAFGALAVGLRPREPVAQGAAGGSVLISLVMGVALLRGWVEPRRAGVPVKFRWGTYVPVAAYLLGSNVVSRQHGFATRIALGVDAFGVAVLLLGLAGRRRRRQPGGPLVGG